MSSIEGDDHGGNHEHDGHHGHHGHGGTHHHEHGGPHELGGVDHVRAKFNNPAISMFTNPDAHPIYSNNHKYNVEDHHRHVDPHTQHENDLSLMEGHHVHSHTSASLPLLHNFHSDPHAANKISVELDPEIHGPHVGKKKLADKGTTVAERVVWMSRTSDVFGSHIKKDMDSYMELIRRRIQEKCSTTVELITQIRRCKISNAAAVTPNEFRFTLIKFGITLDQSIVNRIFRIFDSDGSGTMDFDEFAMWIMNSEFQPKEKAKYSTHVDSPRTVLRKKFGECVLEHEKTFLNIRSQRVEPGQISLLDFVSEISRKDMDLDEREARMIFKVLDPEDTGYVNVKSLMEYAKSGNALAAEAKERPKPIMATSLADLLRKVIGRNTNALEAAFSHVERGKHCVVPFDEFRRCLLNAGTGKNALDVRQVYNALGGKAYGGADIDLFFTSLDPILRDPSTEVSIKPQPSATVSASRADRYLRESIRKSFKEVRARIHALDPQNTGLISAEKLYKILINKCCPMTLQDFRFITSHMQGPTEDKSKIDYLHFLETYNPRVNSHQLDGLASLKGYTQSPSGSPIKPNQGGASSSSLVASTGSLKRINTAPDAMSQSLSRSSVQNNGPGSDRPSSRQQFSELRALDRAVTSRQGSPDNYRRANTADPSMRRPLPTDTTSHNPSLEATRSRMRQDMGVSQSLSSLSALRSANGADKGGFNNSSSSQQSFSEALKKSWHTVLRECHRADPQSLGQIPRADFVAAVAKADPLGKLSNDGVQHLTDSFLLPNGNVNYLLCFRKYLTDLTKNSEQLSILAKSAAKTVASHRAAPSYTEPAGSSHPKTDHVGEEHHNHPWEFNYDRKSHHNNYWENAAASKDMKAWTETMLEQSGDESLARYSATKGQASRNFEEKMQLLKRFKPETINMLIELAKTIAPNLKKIKLASGRAHIKSMNGNIMLAHFLNILESFGYQLKGKDVQMLLSAFRGKGYSDVIRYDDLFGVLVACKGQPLLVLSAPATE